MGDLPAIGPSKHPGGGEREKFISDRDVDVALNLEVNTGKHQFMKHQQQQNPPPSESKESHYGSKKQDPSIPKVLPLLKCKTLLCYATIDRISSVRLMDM